MFQKSFVDILISFEEVLPDNIFIIFEYKDFAVSFEELLKSI